MLSGALRAIPREKVNVNLTIQMYRYLDNHCHTASAWHSPLHPHSNTLVQTCTNKILCSRIHQKLRFVKVSVGITGFSPSSPPAPPIRHPLWRDMARLIHKTCCA